jgi:activator of HSP90 ATPase
MLKTIEQTNVFPATPAKLYKIFIDARLHAAMTGMPVKLDARPGGRFSAFGGMLEGKMLQLVPGKLIVQSWRSTNFKKSDLNSTLILTFRPHVKGCELHLVHINVPPHDFKGVTNGWPKYYWEPLRAYLKQRPKSR